MVFAYKILYRRGYSGIRYAPKNLRQVMKGDHARTRILAEMKKILPFLVKSFVGWPFLIKVPTYLLDIVYFGICVQKGGGALSGGEG